MHKAAHSVFPNDEATHAALTRSSFECICKAMQTHYQITWIDESLYLVHLVYALSGESSVQVRAANS